MLVPENSAPVTLVEYPKAEGTLGPDFVSVAWSPDGTRLAYSGRTIYRGRTVSIIGADGADATVLDGHWESVSWSPDGERLLLLGWPDDAERDGIFDLYSARTDGSDLVRLTNDDIREFSATWSPDGSRITFARAERAGDDAHVDVYIMNADGSNVHRLTDEASFDALPVWSPDGAWIAFASDRDAPLGRRVGDQPSESNGVATSIYVMRPDGSDVRRVLDGAGSPTFPVTWTR